MNSYVGRYTKNDPLLKHLVGFKHKRHRNIAIGAMVSCVAVYFIVYFNEEREKNRRHTSIEKDIERERWRAQRLGLLPPEEDEDAQAFINNNNKNKNNIIIKDPHLHPHKDDGFAQSYLEQKRKEREDKSFKKVMWDFLTKKPEEDTPELKSKK